MDNEAPKKPSSVILNVWYQVAVSGPKGFEARAPEIPTFPPAIPATTNGLPKATMRIVHFHQS